MVDREIQTEHWPERTTYDFPVRPIGALRWFGLLPMGFAVFWAWMPGHEIFRLTRQAQVGGGFEWFMVGFLSLFLLAALLPFSLGLFLLAGRTRLVVTRDQIVTTEIAGPIRHSRKVRFADIDRLELASRSRPPGGVSALGSSLAQLGGLSAVLKNGKKRLLVAAYPRDWVEDVTKEVSGLMGQQGGAPAIVRVEALSDPAARPEAEELAPRPIDSKVSLETKASGIQLIIPPLGFWKGSKGMIVFAILWCLFMALFTAVMGFARTSSRTIAFSFGCSSASFG